MRFLNAVEERRRRTHAREARGTVLALLWIAAIAWLCWMLTFGGWSWPW
jgi:hypothetical protein